MINLFTPTIYVNNVYDINYKKLKEHNIKLLCFDLDNTLDAPDRITKELDKELDELLKGLSQNFEILIVSNNTIKDRVESFATLHDLPYIRAMKKPFKKNYSHDMILNYKKEEVIFVGDKLVTDILGANKLGYKSILVDALFPKNKTWYTNIMVVSDKIFEKLTHVRRGQYFDHLEKDGK